LGVTPSVISSLEVYAILRPPFFGVVEEPLCPSWLPP